MIHYLVALDPRSICALRINGVWMVQLTLKKLGGLEFKIPVLKGSLLNISFLYCNNLQVSSMELS